MNGNLGDITGYCSYRNKVEFATYRTDLHTALRNARHDLVYHAAKFLVEVFRKASNRPELGDNVLLSLFELRRRQRLIAENMAPTCKTLITICLVRKNASGEIAFSNPHGTTRPRE